MLNKNEHKKLQIKSEKHWRKNSNRNEPTKLNDLKDWADERNYGVAHLGLDSDTFDLEEMRLDVLHLHLSISRKILTLTRGFLAKKSHTAKQEFSSMLKAGVHVALIALILIII